MGSRGWQTFPPLLINETSAPSNRLTTPIKVLRKSVKQTRNFIW